MVKQKESDEYEEFDKVMGGLLSVPYSELQKKLEEERHSKESKTTRGRERQTAKKPAAKK